MIEVVYVPSERIFGFVPETAQDNSAIINLVVDHKLDAAITYRNNAWYCDEQHIETVTRVFAPLKKNTIVTESVKAWRQANPIQQPVASTPLPEEIVPTRILVGTISSTIIPGSQQLPLLAIDAKLKYFVNAAVRDKRFTSKKWDGYIHLLKMRAKTFPTGCMDVVLEEFQKADVLYRLEYLYDSQVAPKFAFSICDGLTADPDQEEAVEAAWRGRRGIVKAPTGFGKTAILAKRLIVKFGVPTLFVANKKSLLDDAALEFSTGIIDAQGRHPEIGQIKDGNFCGQKPADDEIMPIQHSIVVGTIQSLAARLKDPRTRDALINWLRNTCQFIMVDECQAVGTPMWDAVIHECNAPYRIFLSATPRRTDGATIRLQADSGPVLFTTTADKQIEQGRLCELDIEYHVFDQKVYNESDKNVEYADCYRPFIVENERRNQEIVRLTMEMVNEGRHVLVLIQQIEHGHILYRMFQESGLNEEEVRFIWGDTSDKARQAAIREFRNGSFKVMLGSTIFDAGVNIPIISGVVLGGAGNSDITLIQRIGRGARNFDYEKMLGYTPDFMKDSDGKKVTRVIDIIDKNVKFFHRQSVKRYYNAAEEFGRSRVKIVGGTRFDFKKTPKSMQHMDEMLDKIEQQYNQVMSEFARK